MKIRLIVALAAAGLGYYFFRSRSGKTMQKVQPRPVNTHHLTNVFSKAKNHLA